MKKGTIVIIVLVILVLFGGCQYNSINKASIEVDKSWANVQGAYQRRADLIPNLVATVKGAADFEKSTLTQVIEARAKATSIQVDPKNLTPEKMREFQAAQGELGQALGRLLVSVERYPDLKANQNFLSLQDQLEGTENRINVERGRFNETVSTYNYKVTSFPNKIFSGMM
ncbi:MAG: LemA family protein, partial [Chitinophagaceae bacterium]|nr:LemA family protein [Chitinophagaceae bacterium]